MGSVRNVRCPRGEGGAVQESETAPPGRARPRIDSQRAAVSLLPDGHAGEIAEHHCEKTGKARTIGIPRFLALLVAGRLDLQCRRGWRSASSQLQSPTLRASREPTGARRSHPRRAALPRHAPYVRRVPNRRRTFTARGEGAPRALEHPRHVGPLRPLVSGGARRARGRARRGLSRGSRGLTAACARDRQPPSNAQQRPARAADLRTSLERTTGFEPATLTLAR